MRVDEPSVERARRDFRRASSALKKARLVFGPMTTARAQRLAQLVANAALARSLVSDQLGDHRIVERA